VYRKRLVLINLHESKGAGRFLQGLKNAAYALWRGVWEYGEFLDGFSMSLVWGLQNAWYEGAESVGIKRDELTDFERNLLQVGIIEQESYVPAFGLWIMQNSRENKGKWGAVEYRVYIWANRYQDFVNRGRAAAHNDPKLKWVVGATKKSCKDCQRLSGRVYRASVWSKYNLAPRSNKLACKGYFCLCNFEPTTDRCTPGRPPSIG
jgi:hypothetical protein